MLRTSSGIVRVLVARRVVAGVRLGGRRHVAGEDLRQAGDVVGGDDGLALGVLALQAHHQFGAQDVELAVQDAPAPRDVALLGFELGDERAQVVVRTGHQIDDVIHGATPLRA